MTFDRRAYNKEYGQRPDAKERKRERKREYYQRPGVKERIRAYQNEYNQRPEVIERKRSWSKEYYQRPGIKEQKQVYSKAYMQRYRGAFFKMYGSKCFCCGESDERFLSLDHVKDNGAAHRAKRRYYNVLKDAVSKFAPDEYQVLCYNCNLGRAFNGGVCPHKKPVEDDEPDTREVFERIEKDTKDLMDARREVRASHK